MTRHHASKCCLHFSQFTERSASWLRTFYRLLEQINFSLNIAV